MHGRKTLENCNVSPDNWNAELGALESAQPASVHLELNVATSRTPISCFEGRASSPHLPSSVF